MTNQITINAKALEIKEYKGQRVVTFKDVDSVHGRPDGTARKRFNDNKEHFIKGEDYFKVCASEIRTNKIMDISPKTQSDVILLTESGYFMLAKSLTDDLSWSVQRQLINGYFRAKENKPDYSALSPQLQFMIQMEQRQNALESRQAEQATALEITNAKLDGIKDVISLNPNSWRSDITAIIKKIASNSSSGFSGLNFVWDEFYSLVDTRSRVSLKTRLTNKRNRMYGEGVCRSAVNKVNRLDIIGEDRKLIEISLAIAKEMAVKYNVC